MWAFHFKVKRKRWRTKSWSGSICEKEKSAG